MEQELRNVRIFKDKDHEIKCVAYIMRDGEIGADMPLDEFMKLVALEYGNPTTTVTIKQHEQKLLEVMGRIIETMKGTSVAVAGLDFNRIHKPPKKRNVPPQDL